MQGDRVRVIRIVTLGSRRGPAIEAVMLYEDLSPEVPKRESGAKMLDPAFESRERGAGRATEGDTDLFSRDPPARFRTARPPIP